jgi:hypothetical protein
VWYGMGSSLVIWNSCMILGAAMIVLQTIGLFFKAAYRPFLIVSR